LSGWEILPQQAARYWRPVSSLYFGITNKLLTLAQTTM
jgi:hypothetical protein